MHRSSAGADPSLESPKYIAWRDAAWQRCLEHDATTTHVSVWHDAGYRCYTTPPSCSLTVDPPIGFVRTWTQPPQPPSSPSGCADGSDEIVWLVGKIVGCSGTWTTPGISNAEALCSADWHICEGTDEVTTHGLTDCTSLVFGALHNSEMYLSQESSNGHWVCANDEPGNVGSNDLWGCADVAEAYTKRVRVALSMPTLAFKTPP